MSVNLFESETIESPQKRVYTYDEVYTKTREYFNGDELAAKVFVDKYALKDNEGNILEDSPVKMHRRLAREFARVEKKYKGTNIEPLTEDEIFGYFDKFRYIVPQGSPMYGVGNPYQYVSLGNCFVLPDPVDSYLGIMKTDTDITQISCRRGGVGWSLDNLRPKDTAVHNAAHTTTGSLSFAKRFSNTIREVCQNGRRGASLQAMHVLHPDIVEFITIKRDDKEVTGSNISIKFTDKFMHAVEDDEEITLQWPIESKCPQVTKIVRAKEIWDEFIESAWSSAEPGCMYIDRVHEESTSVPYGLIESASNPCGEQFLPPYASCRLILLNLIGYVVNPYGDDSYFDFDLFQNHCEVIQRLADDMVDLELEMVDRIIEKIKSDPEPYEIKRPGIGLWENVKDSAIKDRRTGCGFTALGDCIASLGMKYDSDESIEFVEKMQKTYKKHAYKYSIEMAKELGPFPLYDSELDIKSKFIQRFRDEFPSLYEDMEKYGRRNMMLLTLAPCGSVSCLTQTTSGIEPAFMLSYTRRKKGNPGDGNFRSDFVDQSGDHWMEFKVYHDGLRHWIEKNPEKSIEESPYENSTANEIDWVRKLNIQKSIQLHCDNSISNTTNLPSDVSKDKVSEIYLQAWKIGLKGVTIYRDGCRTGVLVENKKEKSSSLIVKTNSPKRPRELPCDLHHFKVRGEDYFVIIGLLNDEPYEVFAGKNGFISRKVKAGTISKIRRGCYKASLDDGNIVENIAEYITEDEETLTRLASTGLRHGVDVNFIVHQLEKARGDMQSLGKAICRALKKYIKDGTKVSGETCPKCNGDNLHRQEGCMTCLDCGESKCG